MFHARPLHRLPYMPTLVVLLAVVVLVLEEEILVAAVNSESDCRDSETRETALETVPAGVGALVSPGLAERESVHRDLANNAIFSNRFSRTFAPRDRIGVDRWTLGTLAC